MNGVHQHCDLPVIESFEWPSNVNHGQCFGKEGKNHSFDHSPLEVVIGIEKNLVQYELYYNLVVAEGVYLRGAELELEVERPIGETLGATELSHRDGSTIGRLTVLSSGQPNRLHPRSGQVAVNPFDGDVVYRMEVGKCTCDLREVETRVLTHVAEVG